MSNFMGPMAPPSAAPAQPQALDFQTDPNQRQRFKQFMQQRMQPPMQKMPMPAPMPQPMPTVPAGSYILPDMDIFAPQQFYDGGIVGGLNNLGKMSGQMVEALNQVIYGGGSSGSGMPSTRSNFGDIFNNSTQSGDMQTNLQQSQMYEMRQNDSESDTLGFNADQPFARYFTNLGSAFGFEDGGSVPPRETNIRGQYHELSYITPDEADILMALGGSGEPGPMGIPQYGYGDDDGSGGYGDGDSDTGGMGSGDSDTGGGGGGGNDDSGNDRGDSGRDNESESSNDRGWNDDDYRGYTEADEQQQTVDMGNYENDFGGDSPEGYSVQDILNDPIQETLTDVELGPELDIPDIMDDVITGPVDFSDEDAQGFSSTGAIEGSSKTSGSNTNNNLLGSDDLLDDFEVNTNTPAGSEPSDPFAGEEGDDFSIGTYGNDDGSFNASDFVDFGVQDAKDKAIKDAFVTDTSGKPIGTRSGYVTQGSATDAEKAAGYRALGLPDPNSDLASADVEASYGVPANAIETVSGLPTDPLSSSKKGLLGLNAQDLLAIENFSYSPPAQANVSLSKNPSSLTGEASAPIGLQDIQAIDELSFGPPAQVTSFNDPQFGQITQTTDFDLMGRPTSKTTTSDLADFSKTESYSYGSNQQGSPSNVDPNYSMTPADQLDAKYGMPAGYFAGLDNLVDDDFASIGNRQGSMSDDLANALGIGTAKDGIGYDPVTDLPYGLEFATNPQTGAQITTNLAGLTEQQRKNQPLSMDIAQFIGSNPYGYELDPVTGNPIGQVGTAPFGILGGLTTLAQDVIMGKPETVQDLIERGAYTGMTGQDGGDDIFGGGGREDYDIIAKKIEDNVVEKAAEPEDKVNSPVYQAGPVLVPSTRQVGDINLRMPVGYGVRETGQINPYVLSELRRYQQMLAKMNRPNSPPVAFADGGSVLDAAAGRFLESLTAA